MNPYDLFTHDKECFICGIIDKTALIRYFKHITDDYKTEGYTCITCYNNNLDILTLVYPEVTKNGK